ncbi:hypothetical protein [Euzebya rosea]|uniref:hypothetical protein n=1 Tax=Euzebya rosea TaxID=2052804 RepID=UPI000D3EB775|nr:hypothetical protein [Euzebya rosea]
MDGSTAPIATKLRFRNAPTAIPASRFLPDSRVAAANSWATTTTTDIRRTLGSTTTSTNGWYHGSAVPACWSRNVDSHVPFHHSTSMIFSMAARSQPVPMKSWTTRIHGGDGEPVLDEPADGVAPGCGWWGGGADLW